MPTPRKNEKRKEFMARCVPEIIAEGKDTAQAVAQCSTMYANRNKTTKEIILEKLEKLLKLAKGEKDGS